jgi:hypothetical protein
LIKVSQRASAGGSKLHVPAIGLHAQSCQSVHIERRNRGRGVVVVRRRGVHVVPPQQPDHPAAEPDAFRVAGRAADLPGGFGELVGLPLGFLCRVGGLRCRRLVAILAIAALSGGRKRYG